MARWGTFYGVQMILLGKADDLVRVHEAAQKSVLCELVNESNLETWEGLTGPGYLYYCHSEKSALCGRCYEADVDIPARGEWIRALEALHTQCAALGVLFACKGLSRDHRGVLVATPSFHVYQRRGPLRKFKPKTTRVTLHSGRKRSDPDVMRTYTTVPWGSIGRAFGPVYTVFESPEETLRYWAGQWRLGMPYAAEKKRS